MSETPKSDKIVLLSATDGPEGIEIYTSEHEGVVDWSPSTPALYIVVCSQDAYVKVGPFQCEEIYRRVVAQLKAPEGK